MKKLVIANWKMNPKSLDQGKKFFKTLEKKIRAVKNTQVVVCPPSVFLPPLAKYSKNVKLGAQNLNWEEKGAFTGELSAPMLKSFNVEYAILGHSERRLVFGETDSMVAVKLEAALKHGITPILCLGGVENAKKEEMKKIVTKQVNALLKNIEKKYLAKIIFAYEPTWAISTTKNSVPATGEHASLLVKHIRDLLAKKIGSQSKARLAKILYGGTVSTENVKDFAKYPEIGGALVGAASLDLESFWQIIKEFDRESIHRG